MVRGLRIIVVDFGGQYTHLIARRCRELGVYSEIVEPEGVVAELERGDVGGVILSGGPRSAYEPGSPTVDLDAIVFRGLPVLGICYGHQLITKLFEGRVSRGRFGEYGRTLIEVIEHDRLLEGVPRRFNVWMSHGDSVVEPPPSFRVTSVSEGGIITSMSDEERRVYSLQFHPEVVHTEHGPRILESFLRGVCEIEPWWSPGDKVGELIDEIRRAVPDDERVICAVSGGVDSMTTAILVSRAVGDRLYCIFVDHGLLRKGEKESVDDSLRRLGVKNLIVVDAKRRFLDKLRGVSNSEEKRRIIGEEFIKVFEDEAGKIPGVRWLAQGTIYPDRIESGRASRAAALIKSHHNVGGLPERMNLKLLEPLRDFYKDEVREVARRLGLPDEIVKRHPFPGPGLAVRIMGEVTEEKLEICREANAILEEELRRSGLYDRIWQAFTVVCDDKWVGVMGDNRVEGRIVIIRIVESVDGMTADWHRIDHGLLERISSRITREVPGVTMAAYAATPKPPSTIEPC